MFPSTQFVRRLCPVGGYEVIAFNENGCGIVPYISPTISFQFRNLICLALSYLKSFSHLIMDVRIDNCVTLKLLCFYGDW